MAILTTLAIIAGGTLLIGATATGVAYYATEDDRARARIAEIDADLSKCDTVINSFDEIKEKLCNSKNYLTEAKKDFTNGGWVLDGTPLANKEINDCTKKIDEAAANIVKIINYYEKVKKDLRKERRECEAKLS